MGKKARPLLAVECQQPTVWRDTELETFDFVTMIGKGKNINESQI